VTDEAPSDPDTTQNGESGENRGKVWYSPVWGARYAKVDLPVPSYGGARYCPF